MLFIGDVHGKFPPYLECIVDHEKSLQVGDFGVGFKNYYTEETEYSPTMGDMHRFIRGNHDNKEECKKHPNWIPDGTMWENIFCVGGGLSIDKNYRIEGVNYWSDEELSWDEWNHILADYEKIKPKYVVSHDAPEGVVGEFFPRYNKMAFPSSTRQGLQTMLDIHKPDLWVFGHWHEGRQRNIYGTEFLCLGELEYKYIKLD